MDSLMHKSIRAQLPGALMESLRAASKVLVLLFGARDFFLVESAPGTARPVPDTSETALQDRSQSAIFLNKNGGKVTDRRRNRKALEPRSRVAPSPPGAAGTAANLTTGAHLAALAIEHDATILSFDRDFARFEGVQWTIPAAVESKRR
jgi:hypothetical protein